MLPHKVFKYLLFTTTLTKFVEYLILKFIIENERERRLIWRIYLKEIREAISLIKILSKKQGTFCFCEFYNASHTFNNLFDIPGVTDEIQGNDPRRSKTAELEKYSTDGGTRSRSVKNDRSILRKQ